MDKNSVFCKLEEMSKDNFQKLYDRGYEAEVQYWNCGQCMMIPSVELLGFDKALFKAGSGLAGGIAQMGDACGAYSGGALLIGTLFGRSYEDLQGDPEEGKNKYRSACRIVREYREKFVKEYGGINCKEVQVAVFGRSYDLMDQEKDFPAFCAAGAHSTKCPSVIGNAARMIAQVMYEELKKKSRKHK